jgi:PAS domain S-box-containing protein
LDVIYRLNLQTGRYEYMSPAIRRMGFEPEEMTAMTNEEVLSRVHPNDLPELKKELELLAEKGAGSSEYRFLSKDGIYRWWSNQMIITNDKNGKPLYRDGYLRDITERKKIEEALRESERENRALVETANSIILRWLPDGTLIFMNDFGLRFFGYTGEEIIGKDTKILLPSGRHLENLKDNIIEHIKKHESHTNENICKDGKIVQILWSNKVLLDEKGNIREILAIGNDITELKNAQASLIKAKEDLEITVKERTSQLAESENKYRVLVENASEAVLVAQDGYLKLWNHKALEISGWTEQELGTKKFFEFIIPGDREQANKIYQKGILGRDMPSSYELRAKMKDGSIRNLEFHLTKINWDDKPAIMALVNDITDRKKAEKALDMARDDLQKANDQLKTYGQRITQVQEEERKRIAYELHDDTAQYVALLKLEIDSILNSGDIQSPKILEKLRYLERDAGRAVDDIRRYSHELRPGVLEHLGLQAALEQIAEDHNKLGQIHVDVIVDGQEPEIPEDIRLGFFRIAQEAISNARKHAKVSSALIKLKFEDNEILMEVRDKGVGFDPQKASSRLEETGSLGLMSMQERAKLIGANLKIESEPEKGTTILLTAKL